ncbi:hypothetical protein EfmAA818_32350 (plasmid) [Enterococcus faecium]|nr:hypothetical protein EfmAA818_32350 [Enterococcus faecium]
MEKVCQVTIVHKEKVNVIKKPVSNVAGIGNGARNGVLLKGSEVIQDFSKCVSVI